jgi:dihydrofolate reductase
MLEIIVIVAIDEDLGIGKSDNPGIVWNNIHDKKFFKQITCKEDNILIMGKITYQNLGPKFQKHNRKIIVVSSTFNILEDKIKLCDHFAKSYNEAINISKKILKDINGLKDSNGFNNCNNKIYICGGRNIYIEALDDIRTTGVIISHIPSVYNCDIKFPLDIVLSKYLIKQSFTYGPDNNITVVEYRRK